MFSCISRRNSQCSGNVDGRPAICSRLQGGFVQTLLLQTKSSELPEQTNSVHVLEVAAMWVGNTESGTLSHTLVKQINVK